MDGLSNVLGNVGGWMNGGTAGGASPNWQKILTGGLFGAGEIGNILEQRKRLQYQNFINDLINHPEKLAAMAAKLQKPLDNSLVQNVSNRVQADMATRGLSQAPGIFAASQAQALAPFEQQNANTALQAVMTSLGLPAGTFQQPANNSGGLQAFLNTFKKPAASTPMTPGITLPSGTPGLTPPFSPNPGEDPYGGIF